MISSKAAKRISGAVVWATASEPGAPVEGVVPDAAGVPADADEADGDLRSEEANGDGAELVGLERRPVRPERGPVLIVDDEQRDDGRGVDDHGDGGAGARRALAAAHEVDEQHDTDGGGGQGRPARDAGHVARDHQLERRADGVEDGREERATPGEPRARGVGRRAHGGDTPRSSHSCVSSIGLA